MPNGKKKSDSKQVPYYPYERPPWAARLDQLNEIVNREFTSTSDLTAKVRALRAVTVWLKQAGWDMKFIEEMGYKHDDTVSRLDALKTALQVFLKSKEGKKLPKKWSNRFDNILNGDVKMKTDEHLSIKWTSVDEEEMWRRWEAIVGLQQRKGFGPTQAVLETYG